MRWATYFAVLASVLSVGLALGVSMPLVSFRLESWGYGSFAIGVMAAMPAIGVLLGAKISSHLAARLGTANLMRLCLWAGALSIGLLALLPSYPIWLVLRLMIGVILTLVFILGESWINQLVVEQWRGRLVALYGCSYALSQLAGPVLLGVLGTEHDYGFWVGVGLLMTAPLLLLGRSGAPSSEASSVTFGDLLTFLPWPAGDCLGGVAVRRVRGDDPDLVAGVLPASGLHHGNCPGDGQYRGGR